MKDFPGQGSLPRIEGVHPIICDQWVDGMALPAWSPLGPDPSYFDLAVVASITLSAGRVEHRHSRVMFTRFPQAGRSGVKANADREQALLSGVCDMAVHCRKDVTGFLLNAPGTVVAAHRRPRCG